MMLRMLLVYLDFHAKLERCRFWSGEFSFPAANVSEDFHCEHTHKCIPKNWQCDGDDDCGSGEDEGPFCGKDAGCSKLTLPQCVRYGVMRCCIARTELSFFSSLFLLHMRRMLQVHKLGHLVSVIFADLLNPLLMASPHVAAVQCSAVDNWATARNPSY